MGEGVRGTNTSVNGGVTHLSGSEISVVTRANVLSAGVRDMICVGKLCAGVRT